MALSSRFYYEKYPEVEDVVMVNVLSIAEMGAYVHLLEYNNIEGMILLSELSRRRIRSINKLIRVGKTEPVVVIRVDKNKGYIDLSKRRVSLEDVDKCTERYAKAKAINSLLRHVGELLKFDSNQQLEDLYEKTAWYFEKKCGNKTVAYEIFKKSVNDPTVFDECGLEDHIKEVLLANIRRKLVSPTIKIRSDIECCCYGYEGIDAVKAALYAGLAVGTEELPIRINLIAPPLYVMTTATTKKLEGLKVLETAIENIKTKIQEFDGEFRVIMAPKIVTALDEADLARRLERAELENTEIDGDIEETDKAAKQDDEVTLVPQLEDELHEDDDGDKTFLKKSDDNFQKSVKEIEELAAMSSSKQAEKKSIKKSDDNFQKSVKEIEELAAMPSSKQAEKKSIKHLEKKNEKDNVPSKDDKMIKKVAEKVEKKTDKKVVEKEEKKSELKDAKKKKKKSKN